jgi:ectoine hydroxylase-related dioxygenase (phytanoyl-CoA dioxygenase family)
VHLPPFAINMFVPFVDFTEANGATEFTLGSHQWGTDWSQDEAGAIDILGEAARGSVVLFDYRTVHRGKPNLTPAPRPTAMYVFGRPWWQDVVNYGGSNFGGKTREAMERDRIATEFLRDADLQEQDKLSMFMHLARLWASNVAH